MPDIRFVLVGDLQVLEDTAALIRFPDPLARLDSRVEERDRTASREVLHVEMRGPAPRGKVSPEGGDHAFQILQTCSRCCLRGEAAGLVTGPINKESLELAGHGGLGHTELLARLAGVASVETVFFLEEFRIFFLSRHVSLREALREIRKEKILAALERMDRAMKETGIKRPRLGVPGLNPHCGDGGLFGREEADEIRPAVLAAQAQGMDVQGPVGADSIFHMGYEREFDAVLALYHDQGHIAAKTRNFYGTVTQTLGLPYIRTSVDHGTGLDIAWQGAANPESMILAVRLAVDLIRKKRS